MSMHSTELVLSVGTVPGTYDCPTVITKDRCLECLAGWNRYVGEPSLQVIQRTVQVLSVHALHVVSLFLSSTRSISLKAIVSWAFCLVHIYAYCVPVVCMHFLKGKKNALLIEESQVRRVSIPDSMFFRAKKKP
jgi:hypothetical protein